MADVSDVYNALATWISNLLYPNGEQSPSVIFYNGIPVAFRVYPGWPVTENLNSDLAAGVVNVNVYPLPSERNISTLDKDPWILSQATPTLTSSVSGQTVAIGGTVTAGQAVGISVGGTTYAYLATSSDTLDTIASSLAGLIPGASASGATVSVPSVGNIVSRIGVPATVVTPVKRQSRQFQIVVWAPSPVLRDQVASFIDSWMGDLYRLPMPDGSAANLKYHNSPVNDLLQKEGAWRRDLFYEAIFDTTRTETLMTVVGTNLTLSLQPAP